MPYLHPQVIAPPQQINNTDSQQDDYDDLLGLTTISTDDGGALDGMLDVKMERVDPECNEDLREYYDVLPDKSVQCKICDKVLKAGWHKYGRHYRWAYPLSRLIHKIYIKDITIYLFCNWFV